jgi:hypothetical protein
MAAPLKKNDQKRRCSARSLEPGGKVESGAENPFPPPETWDGHPYAMSGDLGPPKF